MLDPAGSHSFPSWEEGGAGTPRSPLEVEELQEAGGGRPSGSEDMEHGCRPSLLCSLPSLLLLAQLPTWGSADEFQVISPSVPVVAELGGDAILPCYLVPAMNAEDMELRWFRTKFSEAVFIYRNHREENKEQMPQYAGRTSLVRDLLTIGEAAVHIQKVQASDNGTYTCFFQKGGRYAEAILELQVAGLGSAPQVHIEGPEQGGVRVVCKASSWFPKPQVQWTDLSGKKFLEFSEAHAQDAAGLFSVEAALVVRDSSAGSVSCSILNPILGQEKAMAVSIPEPFFPQASPWKAAFIGSLTVLGLLLFGAGCFTRREHSAKVQEREKQEKLRRAKEEDQRAEEEALKARDELQADLDWRKTATWLMNDSPDVPWSPVPPDPSCPVHFFLSGHRHVDPSLVQQWQLVGGRALLSCSLPSGCCSLFMLLRPVCSDGHGVCPASWVFSTLGCPHMSTASVSASSALALGLHQKTRDE